MKRKTWMAITGLLLLFPVLSLRAGEDVNLRWGLKPGSRIEITRTARVRFLRNNRPEKAYEERNIIDLTCRSSDSGGSAVDGFFRVYVRNSGESVFLQEKQYPVSFIIGNLGVYRVDPMDYMPNLRNIPSFPENGITEGASWSGDGELIIDTFSRPFKLMFPVDYTLLSVQKRDGVNVAIISYNFTIEKLLSGSGYPADFPLKIHGNNVGNIFWDLDRGVPAGIKDSYRMAFFFARGDGGVEKLEFQMNIDTEPRVYDTVTRDEKEKARHELERALPRGSGMDVDVDPRGLVVRMGEILFDFDSDTLKDQARTNLDSVLAVIREKYPDRELLVEGHTDITGTEVYNRELSRRRARTVAEYMRDKIPHDRLSYRGYGPDQPIADNGTAEGRKRNRRVEIIIKLDAGSEGKTK